MQPYCSIVQRFVTQIEPSGNAVRDYPKVGFWKIWQGFFEPLPISCTHATTYIIVFGVLAYFIYCICIWQTEFNPRPPNCRTVFFLFTFGCCWLFFLWKIPLFFDRHGSSTNFQSPDKNMIKMNMFVRYSCFIVITKFGGKYEKFRNLHVPECRLQCGQPTQNSKKDLGRQN